MYEYVFMFLLLDSYLYSHKNAKMICRCVFLKGLLQLLQWKFHFLFASSFPFHLCVREVICLQVGWHIHIGECASQYEENFHFYCHAKKKILQFFFMHISNKWTTWSYFRPPTFYTPETYTHWSFKHHQQNKHPRICLYLQKVNTTWLPLGTEAGKLRVFLFFFILNTLWMFSDIHMWVFFPKT